MEKLVTVKDVKERYGCSTPTARKYIRRCKPHMEDPLVTYEWALREWEQSRIVYEKLTDAQFKAIQQKLERGERVVVPRKRAKEG